MVMKIRNNKSANWESRIVEITDEPLEAKGECIFVHSEIEKYKTVWDYEKKERTYAHRLAFVKAYGAFPKALKYDVMHSCDNPACINPEHLYLGSRKSNLRDSILKGRMLLKLKPENLGEIRALYASGLHTQKEIGEIFGITQGAVSLIVNKKCHSYEVF